MPPDHFTHRARLFLTILMAAGCLSLSPRAAGQPVLVTNLYSFQNSPDGAYPTSIIDGFGGVLYAVTYTGGTNNAGTIFKINPDGTGAKVIHSYSVNEGGGASFFSSIGNNLTLLQATDGMLYGTTSAGGANGAGTLFKLLPDGSAFTVLHNFTNADGEPLALIQGRDGSLYGAGSGIVIFKIDTDGSNYAVLHTSGEAIWPYGLTQAPDGTLYGTSYAGNTAPYLGTLFKFQTNGNFTILHNFSGSATDGQYPIAAPLAASNGALYGTTMQGGSNNVGIIYKINTDGNGYQVLHNFGGTGDGANSTGGLVPGPGNVLYGTTYALSGRTVFKIALDGSGYQVLYSFSTLAGIGPMGSLAAGPASDGSGAFYGVCAQASPAGINGMIFAMLVNPPATIAPIASQTSSGQTAVIWPAWAIGYTLQSTTNLSTPNWTPVSNAIAVTGALMTNTAPATYFRLVWPQ